MRAIVFIGALSSVAAIACAGSLESGFENCSPGAPGETVVDQNDLKFSPSTICVRPGEEVAFRNSESAIHTISIGDKNLSGTMAKGDEFRTGFHGPASYTITCDFHPQMRARLIVVPDELGDSPTNRR